MSKREVSLPDKTYRSSFKVAPFQHTHAGLILLDLFCSRIRFCCCLQRDTRCHIRDLCQTSSSLRHALSMLKLQINCCVKVVLLHLHSIAEKVRGSHNHMTLPMHMSYVPELICRTMKRCMCPRSSPCHSERGRNSKRPTACQSGRSKPSGVQFKAVRRPLLAPHTSNFRL